MFIFRLVVTLHVAVEFKFNGFNNVIENRQAPFGIDSWLGNTIDILLLAANEFVILNTNVYVATLDTTELSIVIEMLVRLFGDIVN